MISSNNYDDYNMACGEMQQVVCINAFRRALPPLKEGRRLLQNGSIDVVSLQPLNEGRRLDGHSWVIDYCFAALW
jgi:hypothetical protein